MGSNSITLLLCSGVGMRWGIQGGSWPRINGEPARNKERLRVASRLVIADLCLLSGACLSSGGGLCEPDCMVIKPTYDDANLILRLYEMRREDKMRTARDWFAQNFPFKTKGEHKRQWRRR